MYPLTSFVFAEKFILAYFLSLLKLKLAISMNIPYMRIMGSEYKENQEALKIFENTLIHGTVVCNFPGRIFSTERAENCYQLALTSLFTSPQFRMSKFLSQKFITLMIGAQDSASSLKTLPRDVIKVIVTLNTYFFTSIFCRVQ